MRWQRLWVWIGSTFICASRRYMEKSKTFKLAGFHMGLKKVKKAHRGAIARWNLIPRLESWETEKFEKSIVPIRFRSIPIKEGGKIISYVSY